MVKQYKNSGILVAAYQTQILACNSGASEICKSGYSEATELDHSWAERKVDLGKQTARYSLGGQRVVAWESLVNFKRTGYNERRGVGQSSLGVREGCLGYQELDAFVS